jgi:hypothetical protein
VLIGSEVTDVVRTLRSNGIEVTAIHSHMLTEQPRRFRPAMIRPATATACTRAAAGAGLSGVAAVPRGQRLHAAGACLFSSTGRVQETGNDYTSPICVCSCSRRRCGLRPRSEGARGGL